MRDYHVSNINTYACNACFLNLFVEEARKVPGSLHLVRAVRALQYCYRDNVVLCSCSFTMLHPANFELQQAPFNT